MFVILSLVISTERCDWLSPLLSSLPSTHITHLPLFFPRTLPSRPSLSPRTPYFHAQYHSELRIQNKPRTMSQHSSLTPERLRLFELCEQAVSRAQDYEPSDGPLSSLTELSSDDSVYHQPPYYGSEPTEDREQKRVKLSSPEDEMPHATNQPPPTERGIDSLSMSPTQPQRHVSIHTTQHRPRNTF